MSSGKQDPADGGLTRGMAADHNAPLNQGVHQRQPTAQRAVWSSVIFIPSSDGTES
jgi:hypothetical protein